MQLECSHSPFRAVRLRTVTPELVVGELETAKAYGPMTFSTGCLDIRHRLPDTKVEEVLHVPNCVRGAFEVSTPQGGA